MKEREYVYRILLTFENGVNYYMKSGKLYQDIGAARRVASYRIKIEERTAISIAKAIERNPDYKPVGRVKLKSVKIVPYELHEINDNNKSSLSKGKFNYEYEED